MGKHETIVPLKSPAPTRPAVLAYRKTLEIERDTLKASAAALAFVSAKGDSAAREALAAIPGRLAALQFEIDLNHECQELAHAEDAAAEIAWRAAIQAMDPEAIIEGLSKESCCHRCTPGIHGGCVLTASAPYSGGTCAHPIRERHLFYVDSEGRRLFRYRDNPTASAIFDAACRRLGVAKEFA
jgi:hypothetical protein